MCYLSIVCVTAIIFFVVRVYYKKFINQNSDGVSGTKRLSFPHITDSYFSHEVWDGDDTSIHTHNYKNLIFFFLILQGDSN